MFDCLHRFKSELIGLMLRMGMEQGEINREKISELITHLTCESWVSEAEIIEVRDLYSPYY